MSSFPLPIILGSSSKSRQFILKSNQIPFTVLKPNVNEKSIAPHLRSQPSAYALAVANAKMDALLGQVKDCILITCDQVVSWNGNVREKPSSSEVIFFHLL
jgi:septum formation protein